MILGLVDEQKESTSPVRWLSRPMILSLWFITLPLMLVEIGRPGVNRTQEARVLETARQMLDRPWIDWVIPKLNGEVRLQKPPLCYWMAAGSYRFFHGVNEAIGRAPTAMMGWLCLATTYCCAKWLFGRRAGFLSAATLLGSYFFARHTRLAETDAPAMLFVTLGSYAFWRGATEPEKWRRWMHLGAFAVAMSILSKGAPGAFPMFFLILFAIFNRSFKAIGRLFTSGALLTLFVIAAPWFVFVAKHEGMKTFLFEMRSIEEGGEHHGRAIDYVPGFLKATAPWSGLAVIALIAAILLCKDVKMRGLVLWFVSIALPLCIVAKKQEHYLLPLIPVSMVLVGWLIDRAIESPQGAGQVARITIRIMIVLLAACAVASAFVTRYQSGAYYSPRDIIVGITLGAAVCWIVAFWLDQGQFAGIIALVLFCAALLPPMVTGWIPTLSSEGPKTTARIIRSTLGPGPFAFFGSNPSYVLCWNLKQSIPTVHDDAEAEQMARQNPYITLITIDKDHRPATSPSDQHFVRVKSFQSEDQVWTFYFVSSGTNK
jgi:4-amino-4-deoxy-L-arabinose transferase-like glycosyltransferase